MCDPVNQKIVESVIKDKLGAGEMFTAFDVSTEARKRGATERHLHMKGHIHQTLGSESGTFGYTRTTVTISGIKVDPWLYHPLNASIGDYPPLADSRNVASSPGAATPPTTQDDDGFYHLDQRNRLFIPKSVLDQVGLKASETIFIEADQDNDKMIIHKNDPGSWACKYQLDWHPSARISSRQLKNCGLMGTKFSMEVDTTTNTVIIEQV